MTMFIVDYTTVPNGGAMRDGMERYIERGVEPGGFLMALLRNDLRAAVIRADDVNVKLLLEWVQWLHWEAPAAAWGSREKVTGWMAARQKETN